jgi:hypothetical protein
LAVAAAAPQGKKESEDPQIVVVSQSDVRNLDGSSQWRYTNNNYPKYYFN